MKLSLLLVALLALSSCASKDKEEQMSSPTGAGTETNAAPAASTATSMNPNATPKEVCTNIAQAAVKGDFEAVKQWTAMGGKQGMHGKGMKGDKKGFEKMHQAYADKLKDITCNTENIAGDHAFVEADSKGEKRLIPFVKREDGWKFDARTYHSFYDDGMGPHHKGKAKGKSKGG